MVSIRVDRLRAAQQLDGRSWPDIARVLGTTHPRLFHLTHGKGPVQRRCRRKLLDGFVKLFGLDGDWLSGQTDALRYVVTADAATLNLHPGAESRWSILEGTPPSAPVIQLALDRLLAQTDAALRRDLAPRSQGSDGRSPHDQVRGFALLLIAQAVETGFDLVRPLPKIEEAEALRLSGIQHAERIMKPWFNGTGALPDWKRINEETTARVPPRDGRASLLLFMAFNKMDEELYALYEVVRRDVETGKG